MEKIQSFEQFLATESAQFSSWNYILNIFLTALLAYLLGKLYNRYGNSLSNRQSFGVNFVMLAVTTMIIITIVKSSLALSLGLVGALSIVRFRAAIKEPEELTFLFLNIAIGLGFGADQKLATIIGFAFIAVYLMGKKYLYGRSSDKSQNLIITISTSSPVKDQLSGIIKILEEFCTKVDLKRFDETDSVFECSLIVEYLNFEQLNNSKIKIQETYKNLTISLIDNNLNI